MVLRFCNVVLTAVNGLDVLQAGDGTEAIEICDHHSGAVDLLLSDILMKTGLSGIQLAEILTSCRPRLKVLLMSGCDYEAAVLRKGWSFISKPFLPVALVSKIEQVVGQPLPQKHRVAQPT
ncbi:MAG: Blue-light-activated protein [Bryobacterales bacterium]|jgi:two-component system cell cycle sensor histidine kinase/response regulator CckA|nr:Blue-light-activated protein [Bryobacterales bacterium]